jgi:DNA (cytosine-5)-methyltransferase 1
MEKIKFIDLFCGMGGFRLAFEHWGCQCVFSSDIDEYACKTYELNFGENPKSDITKVKSSDIPDFDVLCAGFPCQPFSIAGKRLGFEDTRGTLFFDVARILKEKQPKAFFLENVKGITNHKNGQTLDVITKTLKELGYSIKYDVLNAKDYGVPQNRERWYCLGVRNDILNGKTIDFPEKITLTKKLKNIIENIDDPEYMSSDVCMKNIEKFVAQKNIMIDSYTLAYEIRPSRCQFATKGISPCLTAKMGTGGNNVPVVVSQKRRLTETECLKIMGFPRNYKFIPGSHTYKQIGNSVCVPVLTLLAKQLLNCLEDENNENNR